MRHEKNSIQKQSKKLKSIELKHLKSIVERNIQYVSTSADDVFENRLKHIEKLQEQDLNN